MPLNAMINAAKAIISATCVALASAALASEQRVPAAVLSVYDGDTITVEARIWPGLTWTGSVRVRGVDTPEIRGKCAAEKAAAIAARDFVLGDAVTLAGVAHGKYAGRVVADVVLSDGRNLATVLIEAGYAPYEGGQRRGWC